MSIMRPPQTSYNGNLAEIATSPTTALEVATKGEYAIEFENVSRLYQLHHEPRLTLQDRVLNFFQSRQKNYEDFYALKDVSFRLEAGKTLGIIGKNGAGKSTLLKLATRILEPSSGTIRVRGRVSAMLELGTGFHPELTARDNIYLNGAFYGFGRKDMDERFERIVEFSELGKFIDTPVKHFSSGMYMRLGFAVAITVSPDILIIDEVLAVGDAAFGRKCHRAIDELRQESKAMLFVSHAAGEISRFCDEVIYLNQGQIVAQGKPGEVLDEYMMDSMGRSYFMVEDQGSKTEDGRRKTESLPSLASDKLSGPTTALTTPLLEGDEHPDLSGFKLTPGIPHRFLHTSWQFSLPENLGLDRQADQTDYYLAVLYAPYGSPNPALINVTLTGHKYSGGVLDRSIGALRSVGMGQVSLQSDSLALIKLEEGGLLNTHLLSLQAEEAVAVELVAFQRSGKETPEAIKAQAAQIGIYNYFPFCDIRGENRCYFKVFNPGEQPAHLSLNLYRDWAEKVPGVREFICEPNAQLLLDLKAELASGEGERNSGERFYGGVLIKSDYMVLAERYTLQVEAPIG